MLPTIHGKLYQYPRFCKRAAIATLRQRSAAWYAVRMADPRVTQLLADESLDADERARRLLPLVYDQLRGLAQRRLAGERADHTLQATALVHEAYLKLVGDRRVPWQNRAHFYGAAAEAMRHILLDHAKSRNRDKRGGKWKRVPRNIADLAVNGNPDEILSLDEAICRLTQRDADIGAVVRLRFFAGLSLAETASALQISEATVKRRWEFARTWLYAELTDSDAGNSTDGHSDV